MKPIYYKHTESGDCFKFTPEENLSDKDIDDMLDAIKQDGIEFISEEEFTGKYEKLMTLNVMANSGKYRIGVLTTKYIDISMPLEIINKIY